MIHHFNDDGMENTVDRLTTVLHKVGGRIPPDFDFQTRKIVIETCLCFLSPVVVTIQDSTTPDIWCLTSCISWGLVFIVTVKPFYQRSTICSILCHESATSGVSMSWVPPSSPTQKTRWSISSDMSISGALLSVLDSLRTSITGPYCHTVRRTTRDIIWSCCLGRTWDLDHESWHTSQVLTRELGRGFR